MDPQAVLARTRKGAEALQERENDLPRALRHALILVDGRSTVARLEQRGAIIPDFPAALQELVARGLVAPVAGTVSLAGAGGLAQALIATANGILGDEATKVVRKLEEAGDSPEALSAAVDGCYKLIRLTIDEDSAEEFRTAAKALLAGKR